ncbi:MAG TPA: aldehyde dehydrogenase, partial [Bacillota bacterium]|nr:aldehyde dehydrogenase [Bacillota bacterium]
EILATSDLPGGVVNLLTGQRQELVAHLASHMDVNAIVDGVGEPELSRALQSGTGCNLKRYARHALPASAWATAEAENPYWILDTIEFKTAWHPVGI